MKVELVPAGSPPAQEAAQEAAQKKQARASAAAEKAAAEAAAKAASEAPASRSLSVQVEGDRVYYQVRDQGTGEVVKQIPPEEVRRVERNIARLLEEQAQQQHAVDVES